MVEGVEKKTEKERKIQIINRERSQSSFGEFLARLKNIIASINAFLDIHGKLLT